MLWFFYYILLTILRKCMGFSLENLYVDIRDERVITWDFPPAAFTLPSRQTENNSYLGLSNILVAFSSAIQPVFHSAESAA